MTDGAALSATEIARWTEENRGLKASPVKQIPSGTDYPLGIIRERAAGVPSVSLGGCKVPALEGCQCPAQLPSPMFTTAAGHFLLWVLWGFLRVVRRGFARFDGLGRALARDLSGGFLWRGPAHR